MTSRNLPARRRWAALAIVAFLATATAPLPLADTLELRDGRIISGRYQGGTATTLRFETATGVEVVPTSTVLALTFSTTAAQPPAVAPGARPGTAQPVAAGAPARVAAGTLLTIRMETQVASGDPPGKRFTGKLLADLRAGSVVVARAGTTVFGQVERSQQAGRLAGRSNLAMTLTGIDLGGRIQPMVTTNYAEAGAGEFRSTARNTALGALIGAAVAEDGAGGGAAIGAGVSLIRRGDSVTVPPGAVLEFRTVQPFEATPR